jgi:uncharacterized iron-regulated membrane protein
MTQEARTDRCERGGARAARTGGGALRRLFVLLHRWVGLAMAGFLVVVGMTGCLLAFYGELNHWIAPNVTPGPHGAPLPPAVLARMAEAAVPGARALTVYLGGESGAAKIGLAPAPGAPPLGFASVTLDAVTGEELHRRRIGVLPTCAAEIMPFVYSLHYELALGATGAWILGVIALFWTIDCFVAACLTLPAPSPANRRGYLSRWAPAWRVKWPASYYRVNFDLHRAGGLWLWAMLLVFAWSSVFFNLNGVYAPITGAALDFDPPPWVWPAQPPRADGLKMLGWEEAQDKGAQLMNEQAQALRFDVQRADALYFKPAKGLIQYRVRSSLDIGATKATTSVLFDAYSGDLVHVSLPTGHKAGNTLTTWIAALHMADVFGLPYRIFVCVMGAAVAALSVTGVYIWWKKRAARQHHRRAATSARL